jgi:aspartate aminotransferase
MFQAFPKIPLDPIFKLQADYLADPNPNKISLGIGLYADEHGNPVVLDVVKKAFSEVDTNNFDYQPIGGNKSYLAETAKLVLSSPELDSIALQATCGGTQAIRMFADLALKEAQESGYAPVMLVATPTWGNHLALFKDFEIHKFNHLSPDGLASFANYQSAIELAPQNAVLLLHGGQTHNPSGQNLSLSEFQSLAELINSKNIKVLIDSAYFGFGDPFGSEQNFLSALFESFDQVAIAFSYSKNASLYEHRTGALIVKTNNKPAVESQLQQLARESISMAPGLGQELMLNVLTNYKSEWENQVSEVRQALEFRKSILVEGLSSKFDHLKMAKGMFGILPFTPEQIDQIKSVHSVYFPSNGRINFAGVNPTNAKTLISIFNSI